MLAVGASRTRAAVLGNVATETTQLLNYGQLLAQYIRQGELLSQEIMQLEEMLRNGKALPSQVFGNVMSDLSQLGTIVQGGFALVHLYSGDILSRLPHMVADNSRYDARHSARCRPSR